MVKTTVTEEVKNFLEENCIIVTDSDKEDDLDQSYYFLPDWMYIDGDELTIYSFQELPEEMKSVVKTIRRAISPDKNEEDK